MLFVLIAFPLLSPLLLTAISATLEALRGGFPWTSLRVLIAYDGPYPEPLHAVYSREALPAGAEEFHPANRRQPGREAVHAIANVSR